MTKQARRERYGGEEGRAQIEWRANVGFSIIHCGRAAVEGRACECSNQNHAGREASEVRGSVSRDESERQKLSP